MESWRSSVHTGPSSNCLICHGISQQLERLNRPSIRQVQEPLMTTYWSTAPKVNFLHRLLIYLLLGLFVIGCSRDSLSLQSTREYEDSLTALHGASVSDLVERFITNWGSIEAHRNPEMTEDLVSSRWLEQ